MSRAANGALGRCASFNCARTSLFQRTFTKTVAASNNNNAGQSAAYAESSWPCECRQRFNMPTLTIWCDKEPPQVFGARARN